MYEAGSLYGSDGAEDENLPVGQKSDFSLHLEAVFPGGGRGNCSM